MTQAIQGERITTLRREVAAAQQAPVRRPEQGEVAEEADARESEVHLEPAPLRAWRWLLGIWSVPAAVGIASLFVPGGLPVPYVVAGALVASVVLGIIAATQRIAVVGEQGVEERFRLAGGIFYPWSDVTKVVFDGVRERPSLVVYADIVWGVDYPRIVNAMPVVWAVECPGFAAAATLALRKAAEHGVTVEIRGDRTIWDRMLSRDRRTKEMPWYADAGDVSAAHRSGAVRMRRSGGSSSCS